MLRRIKNRSKANQIFELSIKIQTHSDNNLNVRHPHWRIIHKYIFLFNLYNQTQQIVLIHVLLATSFGS
jgi:hypothetical protein